MFDGLFFISIQYAIKIAMWYVIWCDMTLSYVIVTLAVWAAVHCHMSYMHVIWRCDFLRFRISKKWANLRLPLNVQKQKVFQLQGGFAPTPCLPDQGLCPWTPVIGLRSARSPWPPFANATAAVRTVGAFDDHSNCPDLFPEEMKHLFPHPAPLALAALEHSRAFGVRPILLYLLPSLPGYFCLAPRPHNCV